MRLYSLLLGCRVLCQWRNTMDVFVFGSNLAGRHGKGSALTAVKYHGAKYGIGEGLVGCSYAIPTKDAQIQTLPLSDICDAVERFIAFAKKHPKHKFNVVAVGCGLAGYEPYQIAPMFWGVPSNVVLPREFVKIIEGLKEEYNSNPKVVTHK